MLAEGLDADAIIEDFVNYWLAEGKMMADWTAAFRNNVSRIKRTDFLLVKYKRPIPVSLRSGAPPTPTHGPPAAPPPDLAERMKNFGSRPSLLTPPDEPITDVRPVQPRDDEDAES